MKTLMVLLFLLLVGIHLEGQPRDEAKIQLLQEKIAQLVGELQKETQLNTMKHVNQVEGYKEGLWIFKSFKVGEWISHDN